MKPKRLRLVSDGIIRIYLEDEDVTQGLRLTSVIVEGGEVDRIAADFEAETVIASAMPLAPSVAALGRRLDALAEQLAELLDLAHGTRIPGRHRR